MLGGARSGKSALAERLALARQAEAGLAVVAIVTAEARDAEMQQRIRAHQASRPAGWRTVEAPLALADALRAQAAPGRLLLVDCLTLWLSNLLLLEPMAGDTSPWPLPARYLRERRQLLDTVATLPGELILIGNEVGHGIVPIGALNRVFVDENGRLHQDLAARCDAVRFVMAGCALALKG
ncbi:MAG: bifunctional adenosylcobinamide kinase/adenosylcobinamide-phosphate guanylyltransferase [Burkholderiales bacterium]